VNYVDPSDEHGVLLYDENTPPLALAEKLKLVPGHCDPTVNLYDWYVGIRNDRVEALWPVAARGALI
jgi:D-serine deaminase-like pyridoxal phosphate-dependent protein